VVNVPVCISWWWPVGIRLCWPFGISWWWLVGNTC